MNFLANENFPFPSIEVIRNAGFRITSVSESFPGTTDHEIIKKAQQENLIILTFDKDYGEIIFKHNQDNPPSVYFLPVQR